LSRAAPRAWAAGLALLVCLALPPLLAAQSLTARAAGDMLQVRGSGLRLIEGVIGAHLKDGRSVRAVDTDDAEHAVSLGERMADHLLAAGGRELVAESERPSSVT